MYSKVANSYVWYFPDGSYDIAGIKPDGTMDPNIKGMLKSFMAE